MQKDTMTASERYRAYLSGLPVDRAPVIEQAPWWDLTIHRWATEGLPAELDKMDTVEDYFRRVEDIQGYFGLDRTLGPWFEPVTAETPVAPSHGAGIMEDEDDYARIKPTLYPPVETKISADYGAWMNACHRRGDTILSLGMPGPFWFPRNMFGIENHLYSFFDYPELYKEMVDDYAAWLEKLLPYILDRFHVDVVGFSEDMSYNGGAMISKELFDEFLAPFYRRLVPLVHSYGIPVSIDSDGNITEAVDWYASVGADMMSPLERQAGVDVSVYLEKQPSMGFVGHFNKLCMKEGEEAMRAEFERLLPSMQKGKFIPSVDHQTPPEVSFENYKIYLKLLNEYARKIDTERQGILPCPVFAKK